MIFAALLVFLSWLTASAALIVTAEYGFLKFADEYQTKAQIIFIIFLLELILFGWEYNHKPIPPMTAEEIVEGVIASLPPLPYETRSEVFDKDKYVGRISSDAYDYHFGAGSRVEIGNSTAIFEFMGKPGDPLFRFIGRSDITVESINGRVLVSTKIFDQKGQFVAELILNEWKSALYPITWDRNYSGDALEVKNSVGEIVLQVKALPDRVQLQGKWYDENGNGVGLISKGAAKEPSYYSRAPREILSTRCRLSRCFYTLALFT